jgi:ferric-dicitrate binding protein FerR (iron transport regulator)
MIKKFLSVEELIENEVFLRWYHQSNKQTDKEWESWRKESPENEKLFTDAVQILNVIRFPEKEISNEQVNNAWNKLNLRMADRPINEETKVVHMGRHKIWWTAAAALLILISGVYLFKFFNQGQKIATEYGQIAEHVLPDGSSVMLNANSHLKAGHFTEGHTREVWMDGEAYFKIKKTSTKDRFIVHTGKVDVIVTGTQFNVVSRDNKTNVFLKEGSVTLRDLAGNEVKMKPGDFIEIDNDRMTMKPVADKNVLAWKEKKMVFNNTPMSEVAVRLKEVYGVDITVDSVIRTKGITAILPNDDLEVILKALEVSTDFKIEKQQNEIRISPR